MPAGTRIPDTVAAIMTPDLEACLDEWRQHFDWIVLDSPPAFVAETFAVAAQSDLILLVARPGVIERQNLLHATDKLSQSGIPCGLVVNAVKRSHSDYYYGSGYYYGSRYTEEQEPLS